MAGFSYLVDREKYPWITLPVTPHSTASAPDPKALPSPAGQSYRSGQAHPPSPELQASMRAFYRRHACLAQAVEVYPSGPDGNSGLDFEAAWNLCIAALPPLDSGGSSS